MLKLPCDLSKFSKLGARRDRRSKIFIVTGSLFVFATFTHSLDFAKKMREQRIADLTNDVTSLARDDKSRQQMLKVFGLEDSKPK